MTHFISLAREPRVAAHATGAAGIDSVFVEKPAAMERGLLA